jgi:hypothetical protein
MQNGWKPYFLDLAPGETVDLDVLFNTDFVVQPVVKGSSENRSDIDQDGLPTDEKRRLAYTELFGLTSSIGLGPLEGPARWAIHFLVLEHEDNALRVTAIKKRRNDSTVLSKQHLRIPLKFVPDKWLRIYVDWRLLEETIQRTRGAEHQDKKVARGTINKRRLRGK